MTTRSSFHVSLPNLSEPPGDQLADLLNSQHKGVKNLLYLSSLFTFSLKNRDTDARLFSFLLSFVFECRRGLDTKISDSFSMIIGLLAKS